MDKPIANQKVIGMALWRLMKNFEILCHDAAF